MLDNGYGVKEVGYKEISDIDVGRWIHQNKINGTTKTSAEYTRDDENGSDVGIG